MSAVADDLVAPFSLDAGPVRGRIVRLGARALDPILRRHDYPRPAALLLGEALALAALAGSLLKPQARLAVQAQGEGPVSLLVAEHASGDVRGYARLRAGAALGSQRLAPAKLLGAGHLVMTLDAGDAEAAYQGVVALGGDTLAACAEGYFRDSEQTDTAIRLAVGEVIEGDAPPRWRAGGMLMQRVAGDAARGDTSEDWTRACALFSSVRDDELLDPGLAADRLLYRLFHQEGARMAEAAPLRDACSCSEAKLTAVMRSFPAAELRELVEPDGLLRARCQFCAREYAIAPARVGLD